MSSRETVLKAVRFEKPDTIPMAFSINAACWQHYDQQALFDLMAEHNYLFPDFKHPGNTGLTPGFSLVARKNEPYKDDFGCVWQTTEDGITGTVVVHPLADWADYEQYQIPDPGICMGIGPVDWKAEQERIAGNKRNNSPAMGSLRHGHTFLQLCDIRGYENLMFDMADNEPRLWSLIRDVETFNTYIIDRYITFGADMIGLPEDLGMQKGPMLSPAHFKTYIKPSYQRMMRRIKEKDILVHMHSDGDLHDLIDDITEGGVDVMNLQDLVNGIDWIASKFKHRTCVELDIDRQTIVPYGTPSDIDQLIRHAVNTIGTREGGLMMVFGLYPGVPMENVKALMDAMEKYASYYS